MEQTCEKMFFGIAGYVGAVLLTVFGAYIAYLFAVKAGKEIRMKKSIHDVAEIFVREAAGWVNKADSIGEHGANEHGLSIRRLHAYVHYVKENYPETWNKIAADWMWYSFDEKSGITVADYIPADRRRINFVARLYAIADKIRET